MSGKSCKSTRPTKCIGDATICLHIFRSSHLYLASSSNIISETRTCKLERRVGFNAIGRSIFCHVLSIFFFFFIDSIFALLLTKMTLGRKIRRPTSRRLVLWRHLVRPLSWSFTFRRRQSEAIVREGQTRRLPYSSFCAARMPVPPAWHDRSQSRETNDGKFLRLLIFFSPSPIYSSTFEDLCPSLKSCWLSATIDNPN